MVLTNWASREEIEAWKNMHKLYACDPHKHWFCNKSGCVFNLDIPETAKVCDSTAHIEFKWDGVSEREGHYGNALIRRNDDG